MLVCTINLWLCDPGTTSHRRKETQLDGECSKKDEWRLFLRNGPTNGRKSPPQKQCWRLVRQVQAERGSGGGRVGCINAGDENIRAAVKMLCSCDRPAPEDCVFMEELRRDPIPPPDRPQTPKDKRVAPLQVTGEQIRGHIRSFPAGSSSGPDGL